MPLRASAIIFASCASSKGRRSAFARQPFYDFTGGASAMAASAVSIRKVNVSCK